MSLWKVVLPAPRRRHAAGRERHDLPSYVVFIAHLQSSSQGQRGCWRSPQGHCSRRIEGRGLDRDRSLTSRRAEASQWPRLRQSTGSWFVVEYGSQALNHIGTVLGPTSGAKGTVPLSTREPRRGPECQMWALFAQTLSYFIKPVHNTSLYSTAIAINESRTSAGLKARVCFFLLTS